MTNLAGLSPFFPPILLRWTMSSMTLSVWSPATAMKFSGWWIQDFRWPTRYEDTTPLATFLRWRQLWMSYIMQRSWRSFHYDEVATKENLISNHPPTPLPPPQIAVSTHDKFRLWEPIGCGDAGWQRNACLICEASFSSSWCFLSTLLLPSHF